MDISKLILNPAWLRILQYISLHKKVRTFDLLEVLSDIPRATVYHHVKILEDNKLIEVVAENRVRGTVEKVYSLKSRQVVPDGENPAPLSSAFHMGMMHELDRYFNRPGSDYKRDRVFFTSALLRVTDSEYDTLMAQMAALMKPYIDRKYEACQRLRKLSMISCHRMTPNRIFHLNMAAINMSELNKKLYKNVAAPSLFVAFPAAIIAIVRGALPL